MTKKLEDLLNLPDSKEIIERNYKLMQLHEVDISGNTKTKIIQKKFGI